METFVLEKESDVYQAVRIGKKYILGSTLDSLLDRFAELESLTSSGSHRNSVRDIMAFKKST